MGLRPVGRGGDPDLVGQLGGLWRPADESVGMGGVRCVEDGLSPGQGRIGLAMMDRGRREQSQAPVVVLDVVPVEEGGPEIEGSIVRGEALGGPPGRVKSP